MHALAHICPGTTRTGPYAIHTQWGMERMIGDIGAQIHQPSNPYANLAQCGLRRCQVNTIRAIIPTLGEPHSQIPCGAAQLGNGYIFLTASERYAHKIPDVDAKALLNLSQAFGAQVDDAWLWKPKVAIWAQLQLPNGQIARSYWAKQTKPHN